MEKIFPANRVDFAVHSWQGRAGGGHHQCPNRYVRWSWAFWERHLSEGSNHPLPLVTPSPRNPLGMSQILMFCLDSISRENQNARAGADSQISCPPPTSLPSPLGSPLLTSFSVATSRTPQCPGYVGPSNVLHLASLSGPLSIEWFTERDTGEMEDPSGTSNEETDSCISKGDGRWMHFRVMSEPQKGQPGVIQW